MITTIRPFVAFWCWNAPVLGVKTLVFVVHLLPPVHFRPVHVLAVFLILIKVEKVRKR